MRSVFAPCGCIDQYGFKALGRRWALLCWFHDAKVRGVNAKRVQVDEIWSFTAAKQKNVAAMKNPVDGAGDTWTWTAIKADTKLLISHFVGGRDGPSHQRL
jgi:hypothetical protein